MTHIVNKGFCSGAKMREQLKTTDPFVALAEIASSTKEHGRPDTRCLHDEDALKVVRTLVLQSGERYISPDILSYLKYDDEFNLLISKGIQDAPETPGSGVQQSAPSEYRYERSCPIVRFLRTHLG